MNKQLEALYDLVVFIRSKNEVHNNPGISPEEALQKFDLIKRALIRNEPMSVIVQRYNFDTSDYWAEFYCPKCEKVVFTGDKFCHECGQKLDWRKLK